MPNSRDEILDIGKRRAAELGLTPATPDTRATAPNYRPGTFYWVESIHKLLGEGVDYFWTPHTEPVWHERLPKHTHQALAVGVRPIAQTNAWLVERDAAAEAYATGNHNVSFADTHDEKAFRAGADWARKLAQAKESEDVGYL